MGQIFSRSAEEEQNAEQRFVSLACSLANIWLESELGNLQQTLGIVVNEEETKEQQITEASSRLSILHNNRVGFNRTENDENNLNKTRDCFLAAQIKQQTGSYFETENEEEKKLYFSSLQKLIMECEEMCEEEGYIIGLQPGSQSSFHQIVHEELGNFMETSFSSSKEDSRSAEGAWRKCLPFSRKTQQNKNSSLEITHSNPANPNRNSIFSFEMQEFEMEEGEGEKPNQNSSVEEQTKNFNRNPNSSCCCPFITKTPQQITR